MASIDFRGPFQWRARVRRNGQMIAKTFEDEASAKRWAAEMEAKVVGDVYVDNRAARQTSLSKAGEWMMDRIAPVGTNGKRFYTKPHAKNQVSHLKYWMGSEFATWALPAIRPRHLIEWRKKVLDEANMGDWEEDGMDRGPEAQFGPQTAIHHLNTISALYNKWSLENDVKVDNPVVPSVRPKKPSGRDRRLLPGEDFKLLTAAERSNRPWLWSAIVIALETCIRQTELATLTWDRVVLTGDKPFLMLPKTKNDKPREVALSEDAALAFRELIPKQVSAVIGARSVFPVETGRGIAHAFTSITPEEQFPDLRWHDLRHEAISRLFENTTMDHIEIMEITGHLSVEMLKRYTHLRGRQLGRHLPKGRLTKPALLLTK